MASGQSAAVFAQQVAIVEFGFDLVVVVIDVLAEVEDAEFCPAAAGPAAVGPGAHDDVVVVVRRLLFDRFIGPQGTKHIFGIEPAADDEGCRTDVLQVRADIAGLPVAGIGRAGHVFVPDLALVVKVFGFVGIFQRTEVEEEAVGVLVARRGKGCRHSF